MRRQRLGAGPGGQHGERQHGDCPGQRTASEAGEGRGRLGGRAVQALLDGAGQAAKADQRVEARHFAQDGVEQHPGQQGGCEYGPVQASPTASGAFQHQRQACRDKGNPVAYCRNRLVQAPGFIGIGCA